MLLSKLEHNHRGLTILSHDLSECVVFLSIPRSRASFDVWVSGSYIRPAGHQHAALITAQNEGKALRSTCRTSCIFMLYGLTDSL